MDKQEHEELRSLLVGLLEAKFAKDGLVSDTLGKVSEHSGIPLLQITILYLGDLNKLSLATIVEVGRYTNTSLRYSIVPNEDKGTDG